MSETFIAGTRRGGDADDQAGAVTQGPSGPSTSSTAAAAVAVNRAREQQSRWKGRVEAQRDRVFNERTILN